MSKNDALPMFGLRGKCFGYAEVFHVLEHFGN